MLEIVNTECKYTKASIHKTQKLLYIKYILLHFSHHVVRVMTQVHMVLESGRISGKCPLVDLLIYVVSCWVCTQVIGRSLFLG